MVPSERFRFSSSKEAIVLVLVLIPRDARQGLLDVGVRLQEGVDLRGDKVFVRLHVRRACDAASIRGGRRKERRDFGVLQTREVGGGVSFLWSVFFVVM